MTLRGQSLTGGKRLHEANSHSFVCMVPKCIHLPSSFSPGLNCEGPSVPFVCPSPHLSASPCEDPSLRFIQWVSESLHPPSYAQLCRHTEGPSLPFASEDPPSSPQHMKAIRGASYDPDAKPFRHHSLPERTKTMKWLQPHSCTLSSSQAKPHRSNSVCT